MEKNYLKVYEVSLEDDKTLDKIAKALSNKTRRDILRLLEDGPKTINNISFELDTPISTISEHVAILLQSKIVSVVHQTSERGKSKVICRQYEYLKINIVKPNLNDHTMNNYIEEIPIGAYSNFNIANYCGIISENGYIGERDNSSAFYSSKRFDAGLIWFTEGFLEYNIPVTKDKLSNVNSLSFSLELCSEAPGYNEDWKSDIFFEVNDIYLGIYTSPGDYGSRQGLLTPLWWNLGTQFGILKKIEIKEDGTYIDALKISDVKISDLKLEENNTIKFKFGVKSNAKNKGGLNLFGKKFGDHPQDIIMTLSHK